MKLIHMFHIVNDKGEEYIIDNKGKLTAAKMPDMSWKRTYSVEYSEAPVIDGTYSEISDLLHASIIENNETVTLMYLDAKKQMGFIDKITEADEFLPHQFKKIRYSAVDIYQGNSDAIENLLENESLIDVLDNLVPLTIAYLIKYFESDVNIKDSEQAKDNIEQIKNYIRWITYGSHVLSSNPEDDIQRFNRVLMNECVNSRI